MGANAKEKRFMHWCEECQREFLTVSALKSHTMAKHPEKYKQMQALKQAGHTNLQGNESASKDEKKTAFVPPTSRVSKRLLQKKSIDQEMIVEDNTSNIPLKTMFGCPKCEKEFNVYFSAYKHIQKRHCEDDDGKPVSPDSPYLIKPIRKNMSSGSKVKVGDETSCGGIPSSSSEMRMKGTYSCLGCKRYFPSINSFDNHIAAIHCDDINTMIFESFNEFLLWKSDMENKVQLKYQSLSQSTQRKFYHCNFISPNNTAQVTHLCPSVLVAKEFSKGIQIHFYKKHYEHSCEYEMPKQFENYIIKTGITKDAFDSLKSENDDLYIKFRNLLKSIMLCAATVKGTKLNRLYSLAQDMKTCLTGYEDKKNTDETLKEEMCINKLFEAEENSEGNDIDREEVAAVENKEHLENKAGKQMSDDQITKVLEKPRASARLKRKSESLEPAPKKKKLDVKESEIKSDLQETKKFIKDASFESPKIRKRSPISQSPSFNDSYKQFIDNTLNVPKTTNSRKVAKKEIVKTKIGQFIPSPKKSLESVDKVKKTRNTSSPKTTVEDGNAVPSPKRTAQLKVNSIVPSPKQPQMKVISVGQSPKQPQINVNAFGPSPKQPQMKDNSCDPSSKQPQKKVNSFGQSPKQPQMKDNSCDPSRKQPQKKVNSYGQTPKQLDPSPKQPQKKVNSFGQSPKQQLMKDNSFDQSPKQPQKKVNSFGQSPKQPQIKNNPENVDLVIKKTNNTSKIISSKTTVAALQYDSASPKTTQIKVTSANVNIADKKKKKPAISTPKASLANLNLENVKYEVLEQENDCNILVLKI